MLLSFMYVEGKGVPQDYSEDYIRLAYAAYACKGNDAEKYTEAF